MKSSFCRYGDCVDAQPGPDGTVLVHNSATPGIFVAFTAAEWAAFLAGAKAGEFDHFADPQPTGGEPEPAA